MDDDFDSEQDSEEGGTGRTQLEDVAALQKELKKARDEALAARLELRRTQLEKEYGEEIVGLIPESLPQKEWKDYADKLKAFRGEPQETTQTDQATAESSQEEPGADEQALAAVTSGPAPGSASPQEYSLDQIREIGLRNPQEAAQILAKLVDPNAKPGAPLRT